MLMLLVDTNLIDISMAIIPVINDHIARLIFVVTNGFNIVFFKGDFINVLCLDGLCILFMLCTVPAGTTDIINK